MGLKTRHYNEAKAQSDKTQRENSRFARNDCEEKS